MPLYDTSMEHLMIDLLQFSHHLYATSENREGTILGHSCPLYRHLDR